MAGRALRTNLSQVTRRVRLFGNIVGWVLGDVYRNAKGQFVLNFALSVLGVIARLGVIAVLLTFVHAQTSGNPVVIRGFELPSDTGFWTLTLWGGSVLLLSVATGLANYLAEVRNFRLARQAMDRAVDRTLAVVTAGQSRPLAVWANDGMKRIARKVVMGDAMMLARSVLLIGGFTVRAHDICDRDGGIVRSGGEPDCWPRGVGLWCGADCCAARCLGSEAAPVNHGVRFGVVRSCARSLVSRVDTLEV